MSKPNFDDIMTLGMQRLGVPKHLPKDATNEEAAIQYLKFTVVGKILMEVIPITIACDSGTTVELLRTVADMIELANGD